MYTCLKLRQCLKRVFISRKSKFKSENLRLQEKLASSMKSGLKMDYQYRRKVKSSQKTHFLRNQEFQLCTTNLVKLDLEFGMSKNGKLCTVGN